MFYVRDDLCCHIPSLLSLKLKLGISHLPGVNIATRFGMAYGSKPNLSFYLLKASVDDKHKSESKIW